MRHCSRCDESKELICFGPDKSRGDGLKTWCRDCCRTYAREFAKTPGQQAKRQQHYETNKAKILGEAKQRRSTSREKYEPARQRWAAEHREEMLEYQRTKGHDHRAFVDALKEGKPCMDCGLLFPPFVMEYDHVRGDKRHNIGRMNNHRRELVLAEVEKCDLVCCACHRIRSHSRRVPPPRLAS